MAIPVYSYQLQQHAFCSVMYGVEALGRFGFEVRAREMGKVSSCLLSIGTHGLVEYTVSGSDHANQTRFQFVADPPPEQLDRDSGLYH